MLEMTSRLRRYARRSSNEDEMLPRNGARYKHSDKKSPYRRPIIALPRSNCSHKPTSVSNTVKTQRMVRFGAEVSLVKVGLGGGHQLGNWHVAFRVRAILLI